VDSALLSRQVLDVCLNIRKGEKVWIDGWDHTVELTSLLALACQERGCEVFLTLKTEDFWFRAIREGPVRQLERLSRQQRAVLNETDVYIFTLGPSNPVRWESVPTPRRGLATVWLLEQNKFVDQWKAIARRRRIRMLGIEATLATPERAKALGLRYETWMNVMYSGCVADYRRVAKLTKRLSRILRGSGRVHVTTPHGTDFTFELAERPVLSDDGLATFDKAKEGRVVFLPAGDVEVSADEESAEGTVVYDAPILSRHGTVRQLRVEVSRGRVIRYRAATGRNLFKRYIEESEGDADRFGFIGFGTNPNLRHGFTQDDKVLGGVTIGFGENASKGGRNKGKGLSDWWGSMTTATVTIDGKKVMRRGELLV